MKTAIEIRIKNYLIKYDDGERVMVWQRQGTDKPFSVIATPDAIKLLRRAVGEKDSAVLETLRFASCIDADTLRSLVDMLHAEEVGKALKLVADARCEP